MPLLRRLPAIMALTLAVHGVQAASIIDAWNAVVPPPAPALAAVTVTTGASALLLLDIEQATCNRELRPRCIDAVPAMAAFLAMARTAHLPVFYSTTVGGSRATILAAVAPREDEVLVKAGVDKFFGSGLNQALQARAVTTVIVCGTTSIGAVLHTATAAALNGYRIVLPVDCMPGASLYEEQAAVWSLINGPGTRRVLTPTLLGSIRME
ncbi:isochorismatase family protein [Paludibacterium yongneupense]|uniref:isochorismatase family protein n=1 Tax=Paludibacterium yongneupense TaxID=400061 RepID=UPI000401E5F1|nr:isochorismatase family protein [Paludibacterium yongneupense]